MRDFQQTLSTPGALRPGISIVIPAFNSARILPTLISRLGGTLINLGKPYEIILVDDGSRDETASVVAELSRQSSSIRSIQLMRNFGQHNALLCGIRAATFDLVVTMDDDLQHPPETLPHLIGALGDLDVIYGTPQKEQHGLWRDVASRATKLALQSTLGAEVAGKVSAYRVFRTQIRDAFEQYDGPFVSIDVLLTWGTNRFGSIAVEHAPRPEGVSNYTFRKLVTHALNMMTGFSTLPLQLASVLGFVLTLFGLGILVLVLVKYLLSGSSVPGFPFLASIISVFAGGQLLALGIIGEYLARMHFRMMSKPSYVVRSGRHEADLPARDK